MAQLGSCPKCGHRMEDGYIIDAGDYSQPTIPFWHPGKPEKRWYGMKTDKTKRREVESHRCTGCGYLESYAK